jgi:hypothetical protein
VVRIHGMSLRKSLLVTTTALLLLAGCHEPDAARDHPQPTTRDVEAIRAQLGAHRDEQIARLDDYARAGQFPHDYTTAPSLHMFRDADGRLCAVANLVHQDGRDDLVEATVRTRNDLAVADVHDGPILDWMLGSGLTQEELARIQAPAPLLKAPPLPAAPAPRPVARPEAPRIDEAAMVALIRAHVAQVEGELRANREKSLDVAVDRWMAAHQTT